MIKSYIDTVQLRSVSAGRGGGGGGGREATVAEKIYKEKQITLQ